MSAAPPALAASRTLGQVSGLSSDTFMGVRHEFEDLHALGQLPAGDQLSPEQAHRYEEALSRLPDAPTGEEVPHSSAFCLLTRPRRSGLLGRSSTQSSRLPIGR